MKDTSIHPVGARSFDSHRKEELMLREDVMQKCCPGWREGVKTIARDLAVDGKDLKRFVCTRR
jgi:hypothetical protein